MVQELAKLHHLRLTWLDRFGNGDCNKDNNDDDDEHDHDDCDDENDENNVYHVSCIDTTQGLRTFLIVQTIGHFSWAEDNKVNKAAYC